MPVFMYLQSLSHDVVYLKGFYIWVQIVHLLWYNGMLVYMHVFPSSVFFCEHQEAKTLQFGTPNTQILVSNTIYW